MKKSIVKSLGIASLALTVALQSGGNVNANQAPKAMHVIPKTTSVLAVAPQTYSSIKNLEIAYDYDHMKEPAQERVIKAVKTTEDTTYHHVTSDFLNVRAEPNATSHIKDTLVKDWTVEIVKRMDNGWGKLKTGGYINLKYTTQYSTEYGKEILDKQAKTPNPSPTFNTPKENQYVNVRSKTIRQTSKTTQPIIIETRRNVSTSTNGVQVRHPKAQTHAQHVSNKQYSFTADELDLFARIVRAESGDEPYAGQVAVASVILNRLDSPQFPKTLEGVIYQRNQFSPVTDGSINKPATSSARKAVEDAINGNGRLYHAIYFYAPKYVQSAFMESRPTITQIGGHIFKR